MPFVKDAMTSGRSRVGPALARGFGLGLLFTAAMWAAYVVWRLPDLAPEATRNFYVATPHSALWFAAVPGMLLGALAATAFAERHRLRAVFRPRSNRIATTFIVAAILPGRVLAWLVIVPAILPAPLRGLPDSNRVLPLILALAITYPVASLLIAGIQRKVWRFALFCLYWWSWYFTQILFWGVHSGRV